MENNRRNFLKKSAGFTAMTSLIPGIGIGQNILFESPNPEAGHIFLTKPYLQNPRPKSMDIMFVTNLPSYSYIEYGTSTSLGSTARKTENGLVVAYNRINKITLNDLKPDTTYYYRITSKEIEEFDPYKLVYGETIHSEIFKFKTLAETKNESSLLILNDIHDRPNSIPQLINLINSKNADAVFFNGDVFDHQEDEKQIIDHFLSPCGDSFSTGTPFYFVRGNHETRGKFARDLHHYYSNPGGKEYYEFSLGSTHFTVIDTGEDKPDDTEVYANIVDFDAYRLEQLEWFKQVATSNSFKKAAFNIVLMHIPIFYSGDWHGTMHLRELFASIFNETKIDLCISGHTHRYGVHDPVQGKHNYPIIIGGGPKNKQKTIIQLKSNKKVLDLSMIRDDGKIVGSYTLNSKA